MVDQEGIRGEDDDGDDGFMEGDNVDFHEYLNK